MVTAAVVSSVLSSGSAVSVLSVLSEESVALPQASRVESAASQLAVYRKKAVADRTDPDAVAVLARSHSIYRQAVDIYNQTLKRPWVRFPAFLMGYESLE